MAGLQQLQLTKLSQNRTLPKWTFGSRRGGDVSRPGTPGPGSYGGAADVVRSARGPAFGFGSSTRDHPSRPITAPGPGQYAPSPRPKSTPPQHRFGTSARAGGNGNGTPGPGAYAPVHSAVKQASPGFSLTPRRERHRAMRMEQAPGPGAYQSRLRPDAKKPPSWGFGTSGRDRNYSSQTPGPGSYDVARPNSHGPAYSLQNRYAPGRHGHASDTPGPGAHGGLYTQFGY
mmetsp:Transcript_56844/g.165000  ORF Transcript_56844/g.165000 Transcript_56844/m.165000 type:complete len:230 (+) Transcript_56844:143-832(+)